MLLTKERCTQLSRLQQQLEAADLPAWTVLALFLVDVDDQLKQGLNPPWGPYVRALPETSRCVLEWSPAEVRVKGVESPEPEEVELAAWGRRAPGSFAAFLRLPGGLTAPTMPAAHRGHGVHALSTRQLSRSVLRMALAPTTPGHDTGRLESLHHWAQVAALAGSPVAEAAQDILTAADNSWREVEPLLAQAKEVCPCSRAVQGMCLEPIHCCLTKVGMHSSRCCSATLLWQGSRGQHLGQLLGLM